MKNKKFDVGRWYMKRGFFILVVITLSIGVIIYLSLSPETKAEMSKIKCQNDYDCRICLYQSYCEEIGLIYRDIPSILQNKITCYGIILDNITELDYKFTISDQESLEKRYSQCEVE